MPDILASGDFGRDDGIICDFCGGPTYLVDDQGGGLCGYTCEVCGETFQVQYDRGEDYEDFEDWDDKSNWIDFDEAGYPI